MLEFLFTGGGFLLLAIFLIVVAAKNIIIVPQASAFIVERLGAYNGTWQDELLHWAESMGLNG